MEAETLCDSIGINFDLSSPREFYRHGWDVNVLDAKTTQATWLVTMNYIHRLTVTLDVYFRERVITDN